jgi:DNA-binding response OmpR family regulator
LARHVLSQSKPQHDRALQRSAPPKNGITLLILDGSMDVSAVVLAFKARGLRPVIMPLAYDAKEIVSRWEPQAVILQAGLPDWLALLRFLGRRGVPCVLLGTTAELRSVERQHPSCLQLLVPVEPDEVAEGARLVIGPRSSGGRPEAIDLGVIKIDLRARTVLVDGEPEVLPPKEFEILVQLALQPGAPLDSTELLGRVWRGSESATVDDVHTRVWRLRRMLGDHHRQRPLIVNRRGFGYVLNAGALPPG